MTPIEQDINYIFNSSAYFKKLIKSMNGDVFPFVGYEVSTENFDNLIKVFDKESDVSYSDESGARFVRIERDKITVCLQEVK